MTIKLDLEADFKQVRFFNKLKAGVIEKSYAQAINKTVVSVRARGARELRKLYKLRIGTFKKKFIRIQRAKNKGLDRITGHVEFTGKPIALSEFLTKKQSKPISQKGRAPGGGRSSGLPKRRKVKVTVRPGRRRTLKHAFLGIGRKSKTLSVFKRPSQGRGPRKAQSVPSVGAIAGKTKFLGPIESFALARLNIEYARAFNNNIRKL